MNKTILINKTQSFLDKHFSGESINYRQIIAIFIPVLVDQAFVVCMNLLNTAMISSSGVSAIGAVSMVDSLNLFLVNVFIAVATGGTVVVAQYKGNDNNSMVSKAAASTISSVFLLAIAISLFVAFLHGPVLGVLFGKASKEVLQDAKIYLIGSSISYGGIAIEQAVCGALRGVGKTRSSLALSIIMNFSYVLFNIVFINILHMGVFGMVISVNLSRYLGAACSMLLLIKLDDSLNFKLRDTLYIDVPMLKRILFIGLPFASEQLFFNGGKIITQTFVVSLGTYAMATNAICSSITSLMQIPAGALALTTVTVVGQCMGRRNIEDAKKLVRSFLILASVSFVLMALIIMPIFLPLVSIFHPPQKIVPTIFIIEMMTSFFLIPLWPISFITPSALRAAGDSTYTSIIAMLSMWLIRVVLGYILGVLSPLGILGVWIAMNFEWGVRGMIFLLRFRGKKWYSHHLID